MLETNFGGSLNTMEHNNQLKHIVKHVCGQSVVSVYTCYLHVSSVLLLTCFAVWLPTTSLYWNSVQHSLASSQFFSSLNCHSSWHQSLILMTDSCSWKSPLSVSMTSCFPGSLLPSLSSSPVPLPPLHLPHPSLLPCRVVWGGSDGENASKTNSTGQILRGQYHRLSINCVSHTKGIFGSVSDPRTYIKIT